MSLRMIPLREIPYVARETEALARREFRTAQRGNVSQAGMARAAEYEIEEAPGTYANLPRTIGWTLTREAAAAVTDQKCHMPGGTSHYVFACMQLREETAAKPFYNENYPQKG